jgi:spore germination cell wall hydrolase CwlJ-like protein
MTSVHEVLIATVMSGSALFGATTAMAAAIPPISGYNGGNAMIDARQAWPQGQADFAMTNERVTITQRAGGNAGFTVSMVSVSWTRYNRLAEKSVGALRDVGNNLRCLALNIYHEARGEPVSGQCAVGHVVMNRVSDNHYPDSICGVVKQGGAVKRYRCQISWWCDGRSDRPTATPGGPACAWRWKSTSAR